MDRCIAIDIDRKISLLRNIVTNNSYIDNSFDDDTNRHDFNNKGDDSDENESYKIIILLMITITLITVIYIQIMQNNHHSNANVNPQGYYTT